MIQYISSDFQAKTIRFEKVMAEYALAVIRFQRFGRGEARIAFNFSVDNGARSLYLDLYYRHLIRLQNSKKYGNFLA